MNKVSAQECTQMRKAHQDGLSFREIAQKFNRASSTVRNHCWERCSHIDTGSEPTSIEEIIEYVRKLAAEIEAVPSTKDWVRWAKKPYSLEEVIEFVDGGWPTVLQKAGYPPVANGSPRDFRHKVYQNQGICEVFS